MSRGLKTVLLGALCGAFFFAATASLSAGPMRSGFPLEDFGSTSFVQKAGRISPGAAVHPPDEDALQEWIVSSHVNRSGVGDDDQALIDFDSGSLKAQKRHPGIAYKQTATDASFSSNSDGRKCQNRQAPRPVPRLSF